MVSPFYTPNYSLKIGKPRDKQLSKSPQVTEIVMMLLGFPLKIDFKNCAFTTLLYSFPTAHFLIIYFHTSMLLLILFLLSMMFSLKST